MKHNFEHNEVGTVTDDDNDLDNNSDVDSVTLEVLNDNILLLIATITNSTTLQ
jgi:hypothetical protein